jgi:general secretion pathway protein K
VLVLIIISVLFPIVLAFNSSSMISFLQASNFRDSIYALELARSGIEGAIALIEQDDASYDSEDDKWAILLPMISVGEGVLNVRIEDEDRKINVNQLVKNNTVDRRMERHLRRLIERLGGNPDVVDALIDWIDADNEPTGTGGAEESFYREMGYSCKNGPLEVMDELFLIKGFDKELLVEKGLKDYLTIEPTDGRINVNTAPLEVLLDLHEELREGLCEEIVRKRDEVPFKKLTDVKEVIGFSESLYAKIAPFIKVNSTIFKIESSYSIGRMRKTVTAVVKREGDGVRIVSWRESL